MNSSQQPIVVVDDCRVSRELLSSTLRACGYQTVECGSGTQLLDFMERDVPVLVLLDIAMPDISGFDLLARVRHRFPLDTLPVLVVTASTEERDVVRALTNGANDLIVKPIERNSFLARVYHQLNLVQIHRQNEEHRLKLMRLLGVKEAIEGLCGEAVAVQDGQGRIAYCNELLKRLVPGAESMGIRDLLAQILPETILNKLFADITADDRLSVTQWIELPTITRGGRFAESCRLRTAIHGDYRIWVARLEALEEASGFGGWSPGMV
jgi:CheY-like chemotaxis protein